MTCATLTKRCTATLGSLWRSVAAVLALAILARMLVDLDRARNGGQAPEAVRDVEEKL